MNGLFGSKERFSVDFCKGNIQYDVKMHIKRASISLGKKQLRLGCRHILTHALYRDV